MADEGSAPRTYDSETLFSAEEARASLLTLAPGQYVPPHRHSDVTDFFFVVEGVLTVEIHGDTTRSFPAGQRCTIRSGVAHMTVNRGSTRCRFLLVQMGRYDFQPEPERG
jgi:mannose-6-phosphate isomerase-like protein (cupin superfamily)